MRGFFVGNMAPGSPRNVEMASCLLSNQTKGHHQNPEGRHMSPSGRFEVLGFPIETPVLFGQQAASLYSVFMETSQGLIANLKFRNAYS